MESCSRTLVFFWSCLWQTLLVCEEQQGDGRWEGQMLVELVQIKQSSVRWLRGRERTSSVVKQTKWPLRRRWLNLFSPIQASIGSLPHYNQSISSFMHTSRCNLPSSSHIEHFQVFLAPLFLLREHISSLCFPPSIHKCPHNL